MIMGLEGLVEIEGVVKDHTEVQTPAGCFFQTKDEGLVSKLRGACRSLGAYYKTKVHLSTDGYGAWECFVPSEEEQGTFSGIFIRISHLLKDNTHRFTIKLENQITRISPFKN